MSLSKYSYNSKLFNLNSLDDTIDDKTYEILFQIKKNINSYSFKKIETLDLSLNYFVLSNIYYSHIYHFLLEVIPTLEIFLKYFINSNIKIIVNKDLFEFELFKNIISLNNLEHFIIVSDEYTIYEGNFIFFKILAKYPGITSQIQNIKNISNNPIWFDTEDRIIYDSLINEANRRYHNKIQTYNKIWISRRDLNIETYWHKRFCTNINEISSFLIENGFKEMHFGTSDIDIFKQIYFVNNAEIIFAESGSSLINILFMKPNTRWITNNDPTNSHINHVPKNLCSIFQVNFYICNNSVLDIYSSYFAQCENTFNKPYKISNINEFINFIKNAIA